MSEGVKGLLNSVENKRTQDDLTSLGKGVRIKNI